MSAAVISHLRLGIVRNKVGTIPFGASRPLRRRVMKSSVKMIIDYGVSHPADCYQRSRRAGWKCKSLILHRSRVRTTPPPVPRYEAPLACCAIDL